MKDTDELRRIRNFQNAIVSLANNYIREVRKGHEKNCDCVFSFEDFAKVVKQGPPPVLMERYPKQYEGTK